MGNLEPLTIQKMEVTGLNEVLQLEATSSLHPWSREMFIEEMRNPLSYCFIIKLNEESAQQVIGFICFRNIEEESELFNICVHPKYRQQGIGKKLMQFYIDFCSQMNVKRFNLEVNVSNDPAIHLYQLFSYQSVGVRKKFYQRKFDALLMMKKT